MRPILFDLLHTLKSRTTVGFFILVILISIAGAATFSVYTIHPSTNPPNIYEAYYVSNDSFHIVNYVYDSYGDPISGANVSFHMFTNNSYVNSTTDTEGYGNITLGSVNISQTINGSEKFTILGSTYNRSITLNVNAITNPENSAPWGPTWGSYDEYIGTYKAVSVYNPRNTYLKDIILFYLGKNGQPSGAVNVSIEESTLSAKPPLIPIGSASGFYNKIFKPNPRNLQQGAFYLVKVNTSNQSISLPYSSVSFQPDISGFLLETELPSNQIGVDAAISINNMFPAIVGLVSLLMVYTNLSRVTSSNVVESIISKPISLRKLVFSKFVAIDVSLIAMSVIVPVSMDLYSILTIGFAMPEYYLMVLILGLSLSALSFTSLLFLVSSYIRSIPLFLGISIGIVLFTSVFWSLIVNSIALDLTGYAINTPLFESIELRSSYFTPNLGILSSYDILSRTIPYYSLYQYHPTVVTMIAGGLLWVMITLLIWLYRFSKIDQ